MQHDLFAHPIARLRRSYPFIVVLQSDYADGDERLAAPLLSDGSGSDPRLSRAMPAVLVAGQPFRLLLPRIVSVPRRFLSHPVGTIAAYRDDITRGLDWLFTGV